MHINQILYKRMTECAMRIVTAHVKRILLLLRFAENDVKKKERKEKENHLLMQSALRIGLFNTILFSSFLFLFYFVLTFYFSGISI